MSGRASYSVNTSMHCLGPIHHMLSSLVPNVKKEDVAHVSPAIFCPCLACKGVVKVHDKNGTFVALADEGNVLYARCADRTCHCSVEELESGWMEVVGTGARPWVKITAQSVLEFERRVQRKATSSGLELAAARTHKKRRL